MRILVLDTETTDKIQNNTKYVTMNNVELFPHIVQFSYIILQDDEIEKIEDHIIRLPKNIIMDEKNISIHGITNEISQDKGEDLISVLLQFSKDLENINVVVAHNMNFDWNVIKAAYYRIIKGCDKNKNKKDQLLYWECCDKMTMTKNLYCTMKETTKLCNIQTINKMDGKSYTKWPSLSELHNYLFGNVPINLHNALNDVFICLRCFYKVKFDKDLCLHNPKIAVYMKDLLQEI